MSPGPALGKPLNLAGQVVRQRRREDPRWRRQVDQLATSVFRWTGNRAGIAEVGEDEIPRLPRDEAPIVSELSADAIVLTGPEIGALLGTPR